MKEVRELNKVIAKMADQIRAQSAMKRLKIPPGKKARPNQKQKPPPSYTRV